MGRRRMPLADRFWAKVDKRGPDDCWLWTAHVSHNGYGSIAIMGGSKKKKRAHHVSLFLETGAWPSYVMHSCDTPSCVNPAHLSEGDHATNMTDRNAKMRHAHGVSVNTAKLTPKDVVKVRNALGRGEKQRDVAKVFGVSQSTVWAIGSGKSWAHVPCIFALLAFDHVLIVLSVML